MVPASTAIRRNRVSNIDTQRLFRRRAFLVNLLVFNGGRSLSTRMNFAMRAAEMVAIENELIDRRMLPANMRAANVWRDYQR